MRLRWRRCLFNCLTLLLLILLLFCLLFTFLLSGIQSAFADPSSFSIFLLIDNSNSLYEMGGIGSDPTLLRIDAARLFISYLGVDDASMTHQCGVIFFGGTAQLVVPLTPLSDSERRAEIFSLINEPARMGWTDPLTALRLARQELLTPSFSGQPVVVLLTDGKPEEDQPFTPEEQTQYVTELLAEGDELAAANIPLFIILLANEATDADPTIQEIWQPLWQQMAQATALGAFHIARQSQDLPGIYHDIVVALTGNQTAGAVVDAVAVSHEPIVQTIGVPDGLARLTFVISKSDPTIQITVIRPDGDPLTLGQIGVRYAGQPGQSREEIWAIDAPQEGMWTVVLSGMGEVTVWQDYDLAPTPTPTLEASQTPTASPPPTATNKPTATNTPAPQPFTATPPLTLTPTVPVFSDATPTSLPVIVNKPTHSPKDITPLPKPRGRVPWLLIPVLALFLGAGGGWLWYRQVQLSRPQLSGTFHVLGMAQGVGRREPIDLDALAIRHLTIGAEPADIPLTGVSGQISLRPGPHNGETAPVLLSGTVPITVNGVPLLGEQSLNDNDIITLGDVRLRYQNLRLRPVWRPDDES